MSFQMTKRHSDMIDHRNGCNSSPFSASTPTKRPRFSINDLLQQHPDGNVESLLGKDTPNESDHEDETNRVSSATPSNSETPIHELEFNSGQVPNWPPVGWAASLNSVECHLEGGDLWAKFYKLSTEMIITKSGRRMFPTVKARLEGCDLDAQYYVFLDVVPVDSRRYRYVYNKSAWLTAGKAETAPRSRIYMHPDSPFTGRQLATQVISFEKAKLTNNDVDRVGHLVLNSMHKYQPRLHVVRRERGQKLLDGNSANFDITQEQYKTFQFTETQFMAVTAYQNQLITKLKIEKNPFAKGFRDPTGRTGDMCDISRHFIENLPLRPFDPSNFFFQQCWPPPSSLLDSTNFQRLLGQPFQTASESRDKKTSGPEKEVPANDVNKVSSPTVPNNSRPSILPFTFPTPPFLLPPNTSPLNPNFLAAMSLFDPQRWASLINGTANEIEIAESAKISSSKKGMSSS